MTDEHPTSLGSFRFSVERKLAETLSQFSPFERILFGLLSLILVISSFLILEKVSAAFSEVVPATGGSYAEGIIGSPRFINPLLAISDADRDIGALIYSGLMRPGEKEGLVTDLAESYTISEDGKTYSFILRSDAVFHDGKPVTVEDVIYTVERAQDPGLKSPMRASWEGIAVERGEQQREVIFTLTQPFAPFLENLTIGILPKHIWKSSDNEEFPFSKFNTEPIGSGPYEVSSIQRDETGVPTSYTLTSVNDHYLKPNIRTITLKFYSGEDALITALNRGEIDAVSGIRPTSLFSITRKDLSIITTPLPRVFGLFFNQNKNSVFADKALREALEVAVDKERLITDALLGYGTIIDSPFPPTVVASTYNRSESATDDALALLASRGWTKNPDTGVLEKGTKEKTPLSISIATANVPELKTAAESVAEDWRALGIDVQIKIFEPSDLTLNVIRPRDYEVLLFGEVVGRGLDLFAFWHSSQRNDPGLNIAGYASITADALLEKARKTSDVRERNELFTSFREEVAKEKPAIFLYSPNFLYVLKDDISGITISNIETGSDRFDFAHEWFIETERVWSFLL